MVVLFILSIVFLLFVAKIKKIDLFSIYGAYVLFTMLYNLIPYNNIVNNHTAYFSLDNDVSLINKQILLVTLSNIVFGSSFFIFYKNAQYNFENFSNNSKSKIKPIYMFIYIIVFVITLNLSIKFGWHQFTHYFNEDNSTMYSITAYAKYFFISMYFFYIYKYGFDKGLVLILSLQIILMFFDGARTTFFSVSISTLCLYNLKFKPNKVKLSVILFVFLFLIIATRAIVMSGTFISNIFSSVNIEGQDGSYMLRQTLYATNITGQFTFGKDYIIDPFTYFIDPISRFLFNKPLRVNSFFNNWVNSISYSLPERYSPMGGFYYVAETIMSFSSFGPMIVTFIYSLVCIYFENNKNRLKSKYIIYLALSPLFIKTTFQNFFTLSMVISILYYSLIIFDKKFITVNRHVKTKAIETEIN